jgi:hypothetical protein
MKVHSAMLNTIPPWQVREDFATEPPKAAWSFGSESATSAG